MGTISLLGIEPDASNQPSCTWEDQTPGIRSLEPFSIAANWICRLAYLHTGHFPMMTLTSFPSCTHLRHTPHPSALHRQCCCHQLKDQQFLAVYQHNFPRRDAVALVRRCIGKCMNWVSLGDQTEGSVLTKQPCNTFFEEMFIAQTEQLNTSPLCCIRSGRFSD